MQVRVRRFASGVCLLNTQLQGLRAPPSMQKQFTVEAVKTKDFALDKKGGVVVNMKREGVQKARPGCRKIQITPQQMKNVLGLDFKLSLTLLVLDIML